MSARAPSLFWSLALLLLSAGSVGRAAESMALTGRAMGTTWSAKIASPPPSLDRSAVTKRIAERLEELEQRFSTYRADSELSRFNATTGSEWISVSPELARLAVEACAISALTEGAFDVTVDPLVRLWGFGPAGRRNALPTAAEISAARERMGWRLLEARLEPPALRRAHAGVTADFSSLAKGFASDELGALLLSLGVRDYFVQVGGDVKTGGRGSDGGPWRAGIETPTPDAPTIACVVPLSGEALSTAGDYRNFFIEGGRRYGHIIDPRTGWPVAGELASVAVVHATSCARSSALATAIFVMGADAGFRFAERERFACVFFVRQPDGGIAQRPTSEFLLIAGSVRAIP